MIEFILLILFLDWAARTPVPTKKDKERVENGKVKR